MKILPLCLLYTSVSYGYNVAHVPHLPSCVVDVLVGTTAAIKAQGSIASNRIEMKNCARMFIELICIDRRSRFRRHDNHMTSFRVYN